MQQSRQQQHEQHKQELPLHESLLQVLPLPPHVHATYANVLLGQQSFYWLLWQ
jgi:hypothetical protein